MLSVVGMTILFEGWQTSARGRRRMKHEQDRRTGLWVYKHDPRDLDDALVRAYTENVGRPPINKIDAKEQFAYNPRKKVYRGRSLAELAS